MNEAKPLITITAGGKEQKIEFLDGSEPKPLGTGLLSVIHPDFAPETIVIQNCGSNTVKDMHLLYVNRGYRKTIRAEEADITVDNSSGLIAYILRRLGR